MSTPKIAALYMDEARREKFKLVAAKVMDLLNAELNDPLEVYALIQLLTTGIEERYGIKGNMVEVKEGHA